MADFDLKAFQIEIGILLTIKRKARGFTQEALAKAIGVPRATYANLEKGRQRVPVDLLWRSAIVLNVPLDSVIPKPEGPKRLYGGLPIVGTASPWITELCSALKSEAPYSPTDSEDVQR